MADARQEGFTLLELLVALGILVVGLTSLLALLTVGVSRRRGAEQRDQAVLAADAVFEQAAERLRAAAAEQDPAASGPLGLPPIELDAIAGYPGLRARIEVLADAECRDLVLVQATITWLSQGEAIGETLQRLIDVRPPFVRRVARPRTKP